VPTAQGFGFADRWNGTRWALQRVVNPGGFSILNLLNAVSCPSTKMCMAVGLFAESAGYTVPLAERRTGKHWAPEAPPVPKGTSSSYLSAVSCPTTKACVAVGYGVLAASDDSTLIVERWNGKTWKLESAPAGHGAIGSELAGVSCASASTCVAVGSYSTSAAKPLPLADHWNGHHWTLLNPRTVAGAYATYFTAVSCPSTKVCTAVGASGSPESDLSLVEHLSGTSWKVEKAPNPPPPSMYSASFVLSGVSCPTASDCIAVGTGTIEGSYNEQYAETGHGSTWHLATTPATKGNVADFNAVSCTSPSACVATGAQADRTEHWNGKIWQNQPSPIPAGVTAADLSGVSCASSAQCLAVGYTTKGDYTASWAETYS
jgi:hypothetical protein